MIVIGAYSVVCDNPQDAARLHRVFPQTSTLHGNSVRFPRGAAVSRVTATRPPQHPVPAEVDIADFMGRPRRSHV